MSKAREWNIYVKDGRVLETPRMDAECVNVREVLPDDSCRKRENSEIISAENVKLQDCLAVYEKALVNITGHTALHGAIMRNLAIEALSKCKILKRNK